MHIVEQYALSCGVRISKPYNNPKFYPVPFEKYVVVHASSGMESRMYDHYNIVLQMIKDVLAKNGIFFVQIGGENDFKLNNCFHALGTSKGQMQYIIQKSELVLTNDTCSLHFASGFGKKIVSPFSVLYKQNSGPYWSNPNDVVILESHRNGNKPSFGSPEKEKTINFINPEDIAQSILNLLEIKEEIRIKSLFIGKKFNTNVVDIVPNFYSDSIQSIPINIRMDILHNEEIAFAFLQKNKGVLSITKPLNPIALRHFKNNIHLINIELFDSISKEMIDFMSLIKKIGINFRIFTRRVESLESLRFSLFDYRIEFEEAPVLPTGYSQNNEYSVVSSKVYLSNGKRYTSLEHLKNDLELDISNKVINSIDFWRDLDYFYIYAK